MPTEISPEPGEGVLSGEEPQAPVDASASIEQIANDPEDYDVLRERFGDALQIIEDEPETQPEGAPTEEKTEPEASTTEEKETSEAPTETAPPGPTEEELRELRELADFGRTWANAFKENPVKAIGDLVKSQAFTPEAREQLLAHFIAEKERAESSKVDLSNYEAASDLERALLPHTDWLLKGREQVEQALSVRDKDIQTTYITAEGVSAKLDAICELLGVHLPPLDINAILKHYDSSPEGTLKNSVEKIYREAAIKAAQIEKQKRAPRPNTLRNQSRATDIPEKPSNIEQMYALAGKELGLE